jgi:inner membrane protein
MDNLTHSLVGLAAAKAGLEKLSPGATMLCLLAANSPDSDIVTLFFGGRWAFLHYHRGITHSIAGALALALLLPLIFYLGARLIAKGRRRSPNVKLKGLVIASLIVTATHPIMDWTNNYGIRLLLPWTARWFYGDLVFIVDPFFWLVLGGSCFLLTSVSQKQKVFWCVLALGLTYFVISVPAQSGLDPAYVLRGTWIGALIGFLVLFRLGAARRWGNKIALAGSVVLIAYCGGLAILHSFALGEARLAGAVIASQNGESVTDVAAMPTLANPLHWQCVAETERAAYRFEVSFSGSPKDRSQPVRHERADTSYARTVERAMQDSRAQVFLGFARFPVVRVVGDSDCLTNTLVQFADLRYTQPGSQRGTFALEVPVDCSDQILGTQR